LLAFEHPVPAIVSVAGAVSEIGGRFNVYAGAFAVNAICCTVALLPGAKVMFALDVLSNVAVPFGTDAGVQFAAVFQSPDVGVADQVAFPPAAADFLLDIVLSSG
jgi:hypothetical protein